MRIILFIILTLNTLLLAAQPPDRFINFYPTTFTSDARGIAITEYGYILSGLTIDTINAPNGYSALRMMGIDTMGTVLWERNYGSSTLNYQGEFETFDFIQNHSGLYYSVADLLDGDDYATSLMCFDSYGDTLWTKRFYGDTIDSVMQSSNHFKCQNGDFLISGSTFTPMGTGTRLFLIRTDSLGNLKWKNKYDYITGEAEDMNNVIEDSATGNIVMVGYNYTINRTSFVYFADSMGVVYLKKSFSGPNGGRFYNLDQFSNGDFLASGYQFTGEDIGGNALFKSHLVRFDISGNLIWSRTFGRASIENNLTSISILTGDTIIVSGEADTLFPDSLGLNAFFQIYKLDQNGNEIWSRQVDIVSSNLNADYQRGMVPTPDGGFALTGYLAGAPSYNPFVLVKLDKYGCDTLGCHTVSVPEIEAKSLLKVYPNPASDRLTIQTAENAPSSLFIYDEYGRSVLSQEKRLNPVTIDISSWSTGLYFYMVTTEGRNETGKFLIVR